MFIKTYSSIYTLLHDVNIPKVTPTIPGKAPNILCLNHKHTAVYWKLVKNIF